MSFCCWSEACWQRVQVGNRKVCPWAQNNGDNPAQRLSSGKQLITEREIQSPWCIILTLQQPHGIFIFRLERAGSKPRSCRRSTALWLSFAFPTAVASHMLFNWCWKLHHQTIQGETTVTAARDRLDKKFHKHTNPVYKSNKDNYTIFKVLWV